MKKAMLPESQINRRAVLEGGSRLAGGLWAAMTLPLPAAARRPPQNPDHSPAPEPAHLDVIEPIKLEYVFQIRIDFQERVSFQTPNGRRAYVPAISGVIEGPRLQGIVVPHSGADYAGNGRLDAHYMLKASDGTMIYINNTGYLYPIDGKPIDRNDPSWGGDREFYFRCTPVFDTPVGPHDWLTRTVFTYYAVL